MKLKRFCSKCGKIFDSLDQINEGYLCDSCFGLVEEKLVLPVKFQMRHCVLCGAYSLRLDDQEYPWEYMGKDENDIDFITRSLYEHLLFKLEKKNDLQISVFLKPTTKLSQIGDIQFVLQAFRANQVKFQENELFIKKREINCPHCAKKSGGRFDAIVQIRIQHPRNEQDLPEILNEIRRIEEAENFVNLPNFITSLDSATNGYDLKVSTNVMARVLIAKLRTKFHFEIKHSKKLMGIEQMTGGELYRLSTLLRLIPVKRDDLILLEGTEYYVKNITKNKVVLQSKAEGKKTQVNFEVFQKKRWSFVLEP